MYALEEDDAQALLDLLCASDFPGNLLRAASLARREDAVEEFKRELAHNEWSEGSWQDFFEREEWILSSLNCRVQAFLAAGHVCTIMGYTEYEPIASKYHVPIVVTGFEPADILQGIYMVVKQLEENRAEVENQYARSVRREGNGPAQQVIDPHPLAVRACKSSAAPRARGAGRGARWAPPRRNPGRRTILRPRPG